MGKRDAFFGLGHAKLTDFGELMEPGSAQKPILSRAVEDALSDWITEIRSESDLAWVGLSARRRALFTGPPGVGKTTLAHHLGARLKLRMIAIRPENIIDCWVGSNSRNLGALFELAAAETSPLILFFDEFEALAGKRLNQSSGPGAAAAAHYNEMVDTLLQRMERYRGYLIAATNFPENLDEAVFRRFELTIALDNPGEREVREIIARYLAPYALPSAALRALAASLEKAMPALIRQFCEGLKRQIVIGPKTGKNMQKEAVVERILASVAPHPDLPKPRLWSLGAQDHAVRVLPWPLPLAGDVAEESASARESLPEQPRGNVVRLEANP